MQVPSKQAPSGRSTFSFFTGFFILLCFPYHSEADVADFQIRSVIVVARGEAQVGGKIIPAAATEDREPLGSAAVDQESSSRVETLGWAAIGFTANASKDRKSAV